MVLDRFRPREAFSHPLLEYIPLRIATLKRWKIDGGQPSRLFVAECRAKAVRIARYFGIEHPIPTVDWEQNLLLFTTHWEILHANYRKHQIILSAQPAKDHLLLFRMDSSSFYRHRLHLSLYSLENGERLLGENHTLSRKPR